LELAAQSTATPATKIRLLRAEHTSAVAGSCVEDYAHIYSRDSRGLIVLVSYEFTHIEMTDRLTREQLAQLKRRPVVRLSLPGTENFQKRLADHRIFLTIGGKPRPLPHLIVEDTAKIEPFTGFYGGTALCSMGAFSYSMSGLKPRIQVGRYCSIGKGLVIPGTRHPLEWVTTSNIAYEARGALIGTYLQESPEAIPQRSIAALQKPLPVIGHDVWIAQNVTLNGGIRIGDGAVIASNSVVTKDVPPFTVVGGNPAKVIRQRFPDDHVQALTELAWWNYEPKTFMDLDITDITKFITDFSSRINDLEPYAPAPITTEDLRNIRD
jgi:acetyltransferase-like isoleucine patch superfamily enzyme